MEWMKIGGLTPNSEEEVLLFARKYLGGEYVNWYAKGLLGGCKNAPEVIIEHKGMFYPTLATHWCRLIIPPGD